MRKEQYNIVIEGYTLIVELENDEGDTYYAKGDFFFSIGAIGATKLSAIVNLKNLFIAVRDASYNNLLKEFQINKPK